VPAAAATAATDAVVLGAVDGALQPSAALAEEVSHKGQKLFLSSPQQWQFWCLSQQVDEAAEMAAASPVLLALLPPSQVFLVGLTPLALLVLLVLLVLLLPKLLLLVLLIPLPSCKNVWRVAPQCPPSQHQTLTSKDGTQVSCGDGLLKQRVAAICYTVQLRSGYWAHCVAMAHHLCCCCSHQLHLLFPTHRLPHQRLQLQPHSHRHLHWALREHHCWS